MFSLLFLTSALCSEFSVTERLLSWGTSFEVSQERLEIASIDRRLSLQGIFDLKDPNDQLLATLSIRLVSPVVFGGAIADITDSEGQNLGRFELNSLELTPWQEYHLFDFEDRWIATARLDIWHLSMEVTDPYNPALVLATLKLPYYHHVREEWMIKIQSETIDPRLLFLLPVFHSCL